MTSGRTTRIVDDIVEIADRLRNNVQDDQESGELFREIFMLRRSVETLEREVRGDQWTVRGDAC